MWLKALDMCFEKLKLDGLDFGTVIGVSGCAQQHGSVWWRRESSQLLAQLSPDEYLHKALVSAFSLRNSPVWMDSSTSEECRQMENYVGGASKLAEITGSRAYERFTGPQIKRIFKHKREAYMVTERIQLISNFLASILCGQYAPFDASDASGMNLLEVATKRWSEVCLEAVVDGDAGELAGLRARLGCDELSPGDNVVDSHEIVGRVSRYLVERYGFPPECLVSSFTGDNPASLAGLCVGRDELVVSLGTSDTAFFALDTPTPGCNGHVLRNPIDERRFMGLVCFKNGSRTRERIRDHCAAGQWDRFEALLNSVPRGNFGNIGLYYDLREIYPLVTGDFRWNAHDQRVESFSAELEVRACLESQFLRLLHHSQALGLQMAPIRRLLVTGGASENKAILQVAADVFRVPVYTLEMANSACLGAAYLAKYAYELEQQKLDQSFRLQRLELADESQIMGDGCNIQEKEKTNDEEEEEEEEREQERRELAQEKQVDFVQMVLGSSDESELRRLVRCAEPTPLAAHTVDAYEALLKRYVRLETEIGLNNDATLLQQ